jgi:K(+)-stimulated pyrophosphate-energized sodium pump
VINLVVDTGLLWIVPVIGIVCIVLAFYFKKWVEGADRGSEDMVRVQGYIKEGANAFLKRQYKTLAIFVVILAVLIGIAYAGAESGWVMVLTYVLGAAASGWAGIVGLNVGVTANSPTAWASKKGMPEAFKVAFYGGAVMGLLIAGVGLTSVWFIYFVSGDPKYVLGFSFGASTIALFMKAGGGIFTKTADVAADLVGKIEYDLPEDDARNPAAIADNVGDNVGDIAGMGADLVDSYIASLVATMLLGFSAFAYYAESIRYALGSFPLIISAAGLASSAIGVFIVAKTVKNNPGKALNTGTFVSALIFIGISALFVVILSATVAGSPDDFSELLWKNWGAGVFGVFAGLVIGISTDYFTDDSKAPTQNTAKASEKGHALNILTGFSYGLFSITPALIGIIVAMTVAFMLGGFYGVGNAAVGMLAIIVTIVSNDAFGPITDNSRGLAEQGHLSEAEIQICDKLDSAGNTAKAVTKGFALGAGALTVLALLFSYAEDAAVEYAKEGIIRTIEYDLLSIDVMIGAMIGATVPTLYSALLIRAVDKNAELMVLEIRRQFDTHPGILKGTEKADYAQCVDIATKGALKELIIPSILSVGAPLLTGILFGVNAVGALLAGSIFTGVIFGLLFGNAGGTWDNAKKYIEDGNLGGKGTLAHAAAVTGDTVGDPFKDTAGPSLNTLICVEGLTAGMFLVLFIGIQNGLGLITPALLGIPYI